MKKLTSDCLYFFVANFSAIFKLFGPFIMVTALVGPMAELSFTLPEYSAWNYVFYLIIVGSIKIYLMAQLIKLLASLVSGQSIEPSVSLGLWFRLFVTYTILGIAVVSGLFVFIIPGIYLAARYAFADFEVVLNNQRPLAALEESWADSKESTAILMLLTGLIWGSQLVISYVCQLFGALSPILYLMTASLTEVTDSIAIILTCIAYFRVYVACAPSNHSNPAKTAP
ncbi:hypothetical protein [Vibrio sp. WXL103]|uniref:hypothetical protein n=1 Tax=Vibrio sp. WXL103 TaxID=3450710 RepID=UPI003EC90EFF